MGRGQTAKAFLPASNLLSSLKTVTATPRGLACGTSSSFILVWQLGDALSFPRYSPSFRRRRAACVGSQSILPCRRRTGLSPSTWRMRISHPGRSKTQEVPSVCLWREGLPIQGPALRPGLPPRTFTKCMDAALAPLRLQGICVLNYLDDWLILAHSRELVSRHRDIVLGHIHSLGLRMNAKKSVLLHTQWTVFLGVRLDSIQMQARLAPARIPVLTACLARFKLGHHVSVGTCRRLLGLMAAASPVLPLGLLHMRPFLWWMKELRLHPTVPATRLIRVSRGCCRHLLMWRDPVFLQSGVRMGAIHRRHMITTKADLRAESGRKSSSFGI